MEFLEIIGILILLIILLIAAWWWYFTMEVSSAAKTLGADIGQSIQAHWDTPSTLTTPHTAVPATPTGAARLPSDPFGGDWPPGADRVDQPPHGRAVDGVDVRRRRDARPETGVHRLRRGLSLTPRAHTTGS